MATNFLESYSSQETLSNRASVKVLTGSTGPASHDYHIKCSNNVQESRKETKQIQRQNLGYHHSLRHYVHALDSL